MMKSNLNIIKIETIFEFSKDSLKQTIGKEVFKFQALKHSDNKYIISRKDKKGVLIIDNKSNNHKITCTFDNGVVLVYYIKIKF